MKGLVPFWVDVVVYVLGPLSAFRGRRDEKLHIWVWSVHWAHKQVQQGYYTAENQTQNNHHQVLLYFFYCKFTWITFQQYEVKAW